MAHTFTPEIVVSLFKNSILSIVTFLSAHHTSKFIKKALTSAYTVALRDSRQTVSTCIETLVRINIRARHEAHFIFSPLMFRG